MQCIILAGGLATRMRPLTTSLPKSLIPVMGRPFLDYQLLWLKEHGVTNVILCIGHLGDQIRAFSGDGSRWGIHIDYVNEGNTLLGTGGALRLALEEKKLAESFLLTYGDSFLPVDFSTIGKCFLESGCLGLMTVLKNQGRWDQSNAQVENERVTYYNKSKNIPSTVSLQYIDYGLLAFKKLAIEKFTKKGSKQDLADVFTALSHQGELAAYEVRERFYEVGSADGLNAFTDFVKKRGLSE